MPWRRACAPGPRAWTPRPGGFPAVMVFCYDNDNARGGGSTSSLPLPLPLPLLDPQWDGRARGEELLVPAPRYERVPGRRPRRVRTYSLGEAVRRWPVLCYGGRFRANFVRRYFICVDSGDVETDGVVLVRVD